MKRLLLYPVLVLALGACNNNKAEREAEIEQATAAAVDSLNDMNERIRMEDSLESLADATVIPAPSSETPDGPRTTRRPSGGTKKSTEPSGKGNDENKTAGTPTVTPETTGGPEEETGTAGTETKEPEAEEKKKKGINNTVKGAVIGAGAGAVGGAIINKKNPGKGAVIGGVIGAGAGAVTGVIIDKNKKKKQAAKDSASTKTTTKEPDTKSGDGDVKP